MKPGLIVPIKQELLYLLKPKNTNTMTRTIAAVFAAFALISCSSNVVVEQTRQEVLLEEGWKFTREDGDFAQVDFDDSQWQSVTVPHDWAIYGPFDSNNDAQVVAITQNFERFASLKTGRTGGLPYVGTGWYRLEFDVPDFTQGKKAELLFDGAMSYSKVYVNGKYVGEWPYGYNSFHFDVTDFVNPDGKDNVLAVRLENLPQSSRWYPGAGLYRNVHLIVTDGIPLQQKLAVHSEKSGVQVKGSLQVILVENFNQAPILGRAVVIAECNGLHFSMKHSIPPSIPQSILALFYHGLLFLSTENLFRFFLYFSLTLGVVAGKIDSVWCTLAAECPCVS